MNHIPSSTPNEAHQATIIGVISWVLSGFLLRGPHKTHKKRSHNYEIRTDFGVFLELFADSTDTWHPVIGSRFNLFFSDKKKNLKNREPSSMIMMLLGFWTRQSVDFDIESTRSMRMAMPTYLYNNRDRPWTYLEPTSSIFKYNIRLIGSLLSLSLT